MQLLAPLKTSASIYSGSGNLFLITTTTLSTERVVSLCEHHGLDGVIYFLPPYTMRIFNSDGSEAQMCGNGLRCLLAFLWEEGDHQECYTISTLAGWHKGHYKDGWSSIEFPVPSAVHLRRIDHHDFYCLNTGVPHAVYLGFCDDFRHLGARYVRHPAFGKEGSNITQCLVQKDKSLYVQTFERGVERITGACGTGCLAASIVACSQYSLSSPIKITVPSLEELYVTLSPFTLKGKATLITKNVPLNDQP
ncbi:MAG: diaminopimelate epimerase [Verrucomicrobia bacterium]|nr:diaminopimelate epimerase [Verrucomicrobiota bacterium]MBS0646609.1 diaminopimelate epimerase [Verrucomicrobiota bacterium]